MTTLQERLVVWRKALHDASAGPLRIARDIVQLGERWESYREEASGLDCTTWLRANLGRGHGLGFFQRVAHAVDVIGEHCRRTYHWRVACYVAQNVPASKVGLVDKAIRDATVSNGGVPLSPDQGERAVKRVLKHKPQRARCARCERLERFISDNGLEVPE